MIAHNRMVRNSSRARGRISLVQLLEEKSGFEQSIQLTHSDDLMYGQLLSNSSFFTLGRLCWFLLIFLLVVFDCINDANFVVIVGHQRLARVVFFFDPLFSTNFRHPGLPASASTANFFTFLPLLKASLGRFTSTA